MSDLIEPELAGATLVANFDDMRPKRGEAVGWRLGQSGVVLKFPDATVLVDAYLSNHCEAALAAPFDHRRMTRSPLDPVELDQIDLVVCSHSHLDHLDPPTMRTLARENPEAKAAAPRDCLPLLRELGWADDHLLAFDDGTALHVGELRVESFAVPHDEFDKGPDGHPYLGWILDDGAVRIAHLGDARVHPRIKEALSNETVDLLLVPINGRSPERAAMGFAGNMNAAEAVELARSCGAALTIPMHYDMFRQNVDGGALEAFAAEAGRRGIAFVTIPVGRPVTIKGAR